MIRLTTSVNANTNEKQGKVSSMSAVCVYGDCIGREGNMCGNKPLSLITCTRFIMQF